MQIRCVQPAGAIGRFSAPPGARTFAPGNRFKRTLEHRRAFQNKIKEGWTFFRFPMGTGSQMMK